MAIWGQNHPFKGFSEQNSSTKGQIILLHKLNAEFHAGLSVTKENDFIVPVTKNTILHPFGPGPQNFNTTFELAYRCL